MHNASQQLLSAADERARHQHAQWDFIMPLPATTPACKHAIAAAALW
jgi:hypothetical protein